MAVVTVGFRKCVQDSQEYGSDDEHMVSRVFFDIEVEGRVVEGLYADIKQAAGGNFEADAIEVSPPRGTPYRGPFNYQRFRDEAEQYFRGLVGAEGMGIRIEGASNVRMQNNTYRMPKTVQFESAGEEGAW